MSRDDGFAFVRLNRPDKGNALSRELVLSLRAQWEAAIADPGVHTIVFAGEGRNFCTGFDLSDLDAEDDAELLQRFIELELLLDAVWCSPVRTVVVAKGKTWGAGADLLVACDLRLAEPATDLRFPGARFGLVLGTQRLAQRVGVDMARRMSADGLAVRGREAVDLRLLSAVVEDISEAAACEMAGTPVADRETVAQLRCATRPAVSDASLAALVRSAARQGLAQRIRRYRGQGTARRQHEA